LRLSAWLSVQSGYWLRARLIFQHLAATGVTGTRKQESAALLEKTRTMMGDNPLLAQGRLRLAAIRES
jgi:hypothetical protein